MTTDAPIPGPWPAAAPSEHPFELLTAYLDDQATPVERAEVDAHLAGCPTCRHALDAEATVRSLVRTLPAVEPPDDFYARVLARGPQPRHQVHRRTGFAVANVAAAAAVWIGVLGVARITRAPAARPAIGALTSAHASVLGTGTSARTLKADSSAPRSIARYEYVGTLTIDGREQMLYSDGTRTLSMFVEAGELDESVLPADARQIVVAGLPAWLVVTESAEVVLVQRPGVVVVLVGPLQSEEEALVRDADADAPDPSLGERIDAAARGLLDTFGL